MLLQNYCSVQNIYKSNFFCKYIQFIFKVLNRFYLYSLQNDAIQFSSIQKGCFSYKDIILEQYKFCIAHHYFSENCRLNISLRKLISDTYILAGNLLMHFSKKPKSISCQECILKFK